VPTYDYECEQCHRTYEVWQRISAPPLETCQYCGGAVRRLLAAAPFILKGSGWYVTDYPSEARKKALESEKKSGPAEPAGTSTRSEGAPSATSGTSSPSSPTTKD
jgi:putative FmdB family regulatory protein